VAGLNAGGEERVTLKVKRLRSISFRDAGVADQQVSQTIVCEISL
jgi:hypothetical protein